MHIIRNDVGNAGDVRRVLRTLSTLKPHFGDLHAGAAFEKEGMSFRVLRVDRNVLAEVRVTGMPLALIMKYPVAVEGKFSKTAEWEAGQWEAVGDILAGTEVGLLPTLIAFDDETSTLFLEKIRGWTAHRALAAGTLLTISRLWTRRLYARFYELGRVLAILHTHASPRQGSPIWYGLDAKLASVSAKRDNDQVMEAGYTAFIKSRDPQSRHLTWVHGNLRTDNILLTCKGVALIDLENAGAGDPMEDIGRLLAFVIMLPRSPLFSRRFYGSVVDQIVRGYCAIAKPLPTQLLACILGEMLFVYGADYASITLSTFRRYCRAMLARSIANVVTLLRGDAEQFLARPSMIVV